MSNENKIKEQFEEMLNQTGYSLESFVEKKLKKTFFVSRQPYYLDEDSGQGRTLDLLAQVSYFQSEKNKQIIQLFLPIECKSLPDHAWIFFEGSFDLFNLIPEYVEHEKISGYDKLKSISFIPLEDLFVSSACAELRLTNKKKYKKSNNREDNLYEAILSVVKATRHFMEYEKEKILHQLKLPKTKYKYVLSIYQPVIVFNGRMYEAKENNEKITLNNIKFAQLNKEYISKNYNEKLGRIHIVSYDALDEYVQIIKNHYNIKESAEEFRQRILKS